MMTTDRLCTLILALLFLALPGFAQTGQGEQEASKSAQTKSVSQDKEKGKVSVETTLIKMEKQAWEAVKNRDTNSFGNLFSSDGMMADSSGFTTRPAFYQTLPDLTITDYTLEDFKVTMIDKDSAIITYKATVKGSYKGQAFPSNPSYTSSVWAKRNGKWVAVYHQETMAQQ
jgi:hypothetical protein